MIPKGQTLFENEEIANLWDQARRKDQAYHSIHGSVTVGQPAFPVDLKLNVQIKYCTLDERRALMRRGVLWVPNWEQLKTSIIQKYNDSNITG